MDLEIKYSKQQCKCERRDESEYVQKKCKSIKLYWYQTIISKLPSHQLYLAV